MNNSIKILLFVIGVLRFEKQGVRKAEKVVIFLLLLLSAQQIAHANVSLNALFSDHMVVQRETQIPIWGWADPMEKITIKASWGAEAETVANIDSTWSVYLDTPKGGGPFTLTISGKNEIVLNDVLSGEVWLCGGQSNMDHHLSTYISDAREPQYQPLVEYIRNEITTAIDTLLRTIVVPHKTNIHKQETNFKADWVSVNSKNTGLFSATGYFFAKELRKKLNVPVGLVECARGATRIQPWISEETYMADEEMKTYFMEEMKLAKEKMLIMDAENYVDTIYQRKLKVWEEKGKQGRKPSPEHHPNDGINIPANFYNGMIAAIVPYKIKGAIWYQGEANSTYMTNSYEEYFTTLIKSWRANWKQGDFPFYWAQLSAYRQPNSEPLEDCGWASINDQQRRTLKVPNTGMAVTYDIGEAEDIHPHNKMDVGKRLSLWAIKNDYGYKKAVCSGPLYHSHKIKNGTIEILFDQVGSGLMVGKKDLLNETVEDNKPLQRFQIAGTDGKWLWANAVILSKKKIAVFHPDIPVPSAVRYAWSDNPEGANLYNKEGLPASVFTTEE